MDDSNKHDGFDYLKLLLDNKWLVLALLSFAGSALGNGFQYTESEKDKEQIDALATGYRTLVYQKAPPVKYVKEDNCAVCKELMRAHIKEFH